MFQTPLPEMLLGDYKNTFIDPFAEEAASSSPSMWTLSSRSKGKRAVAGEKKDLDKAETSDENVQSPEPFMVAEGAESDERAQFGSNTNDDVDSEGHAVHDVSVDDIEELQDIEEAIASAQSPFLPLLEYLYKKVKGQDTELPPVHPTFICQEHKELYQYAYDKLHAKDQEDKDKDKGKKDKSRPYHVDKDVLVALSGIVNTISPSTRSFTTTSAIKIDSLVMALDEKDEDLAGLMDELAEAYSPEHKEDPLSPLDIESLRMKIWSLLLENGATSPKTRIVRRKMQVLQVVDHISVLLGGQVVRGIPGELASQAAKDVRLHVEAKYGVTTKNVRGRKVDISVRVFANNTWENEICIFEFKTSKASDLICAKQQLKSVRINTAVLHD
ncbi:hypothetical protein BGZ82_000461 [Podila clonocystis]|nr:hypothetical protein BGZ82_000461 [Podila clonocystis]